MNHRSRLTAALLTAALVTAAEAQWDPANGQWGKSNPNQVRVMTWNIEDGICSTATKRQGFNSWHGLTRIVAAMQPDVLIMQEVGDNDGNGTGFGVDTVQNLRTTLNLFIEGGEDPFNSQTVNAYVQKYAPGYDLPYKFISSATDGFNRNVILSRFPFADLNGDGDARFDDIPLVLPDLYAPGGTGGIRGFQFGELDLPDETYPGDLVIGNAHLKSGGTSSDLAQRLAAAKNVAYFIEHYYNGAGTGTVDPRTNISDNPQATTILGPNTPVVIGGDWNEDESSNGRKGPAAWLTWAEFVDGTDSDGTDRDRSDATYDTAANVFTGNASTQSSSKLDYIATQDSIAAFANQFAFNSGSMGGSPFPPELADYGNAALLSGLASDHRPVIVDLDLPVLVANCPEDIDGDDDVDLSDLAVVLGNFGRPDATPGEGDTDGDGDVDLSDLATLLGAFGCG